MARAAEHAYRKIRQDIIDGRFPPGTHLREEDLAALTKVSRTPVREALRRLQVHGFVEFHPNRGARVPSWSAQDLEELFSLRTLLEPYAARLAATRIQQADLELLDRLATQMVAAPSRAQDDRVETISELNNNFHQTVVRASGNCRLERIMRGLVEVPLVLRTFHHYSQEELSRSLAHHQELVAALRAGNSRWAEAVMRAHIQAAYTALCEPDEDGV